MAKSKLTKLVTVTSLGQFWELGGISGPISNVMRMSVDDIYILLIHNRVVWAHNPKNLKQKKRLTLKNYLIKDIFAPDADEPQGDLVMGIEGMPDDDRIDDNDKIYVDIGKTLKKDGVVQPHTMSLSDEEPVEISV